MGLGLSDHKYVIVVVYLLQSSPNGNPAVDVAYEKEKNTK